MMVINMIMGVVIPVVLFIVVRKKSGGSAKAFFVGCGVMFLFALTLESVVHNLVYMSPVGQTIWNNIWLYALYGGFMAGLFEETGRFLAFRSILKKQHGNDGNAWTYGAGHGGFEAFYILVFGTINTFFYALTINSGGYEQIMNLLPEDQKVVFAEAVETIVTTPAPMYLLSIFERGSALVIHFGLSLLVWLAATRGKEKRIYYPLAILLHALVDGVMVIFNNFAGNPVFTEIFVLAEAVGCFALCLWIWKKDKSVEVKQENEAE